MNIYILYHGNCPDGFGAAWAAWKILGDKATYIPVQHDHPIPEIEKGSQVYIVDFSYPAEILKSLTELMYQVVVLDHHKTAQAALGNFPSLEAVEQGESNIGVLFDMEKSGAMLTWEHFHPSQPIPDLIRYVQDKDLWQFNMPDSKAFSAGLSSHPFDFEFWDNIDPEQLIQEGKILLRMLDGMVERLAERAYWRDVGGYNVPVVNTPILASELGNQLCHKFPEAPFCACYSDSEGGKRYWELRSKGSFDVGEVAKSMGGGGHRNASGFREILDH